MPSDAAKNKGAFGKGYAARCIHTKPIQTALPEPPALDWIDAKRASETTVERISREGKTRARIAYERAQLEIDAARALIDPNLIRLRATPDPAPEDRHADTFFAEDDYFDDGCYEIGFDANRNPIRIDRYGVENPETPDLRHTGVARWYSRAEGRYLALAKRETGRHTSGEKMKEARVRREVMIAYSHAVAGKLKKRGVKSYRCTPFGVFKYSIHSRVIEEIPAFASNNFIPYSACAARKRIVREVTAYLAAPENEFCRMWVMTNGDRCNVFELRSRIKALSRKISKLNAEPWFRKIGQMVIRCNEVGSIDADGSFMQNSFADTGGEIPRDDQGRRTYHPHSHVIFRPNKWREPRLWEKFIKRVWKWWGFHWKDCSMVQDAREIVKYCTKPAEVANLNEDETFDLYNALHGLHLVETLGPLRAQIENRRRRIRTLVTTHTHDGPVLTEEPDWNRRLPKKKDRERDNMEAMQKLTRHEGESHMFLVARTVPMPGGWNISEPHVIVTGTVFNEQAVRAMPLVAELIRATQPEWNDAVAATGAIKVHGCGKVVRMKKDERPPPRQLSADAGPIFEHASAGISKSTNV